MGVGEQQRRERILDLLGTIIEQPKPPSTMAVGALAMRSWALTRRTSQDYIDDLVAMGYARLHADGTITATELGERAVLELPARPKAPAIPASEVPLPPSPPSSKPEEGVGGTENAEQG